MTFKTRKIQPRKVNNAAQSRKTLSRGTTQKTRSTQRVFQHTQKPVKPFHSHGASSVKPLHSHKTSKKTWKKKSQINRSPNYQVANKKTYHGKSPMNRISVKQQGSNNLRIIPLGGCEEVGRNMTIFEYKNDIVIVDMGLQFPEEDQPGIDYIIPNVEYLKGKEKNIRGVIFTHGHLDHIGAAPLLLEKLGNPLIVGGKLTLNLIKARQEDYKKNTSKNLKTKLVESYNYTLKLGNFKAKFFQVSHTVMDSMGIILETDNGTVIHPGDWKLSHNTDAKKNEYEHLSKLPKPTILMLESLGVTYSKPPVPEEEMYKNIEKLVKEAPGRVIISTFSSNVERVKVVLEMAEKYKRKVALDGFSMKTNIEIAKKLGYIKFNLKNLISIQQISNLPDNKVIAIVTGAQGEDRAVLNRIVNGTHRFIKFKKADTIIFSSSVIPGNERTVQRLKDNIYRQCDNVIHSEIMDVHSGGHATANDIKEVIRQIKPTYFMPVYANHYMLKEAAMLAKRELGYTDKNIFIPDNGSVVELNNRTAKILAKKINVNPVMIDGLGVADLKNVVLRDRQILAEQGMVVIISTLKSSDKKLIQQPDVISRGFVYLDENKGLITELKKKVRKIIEKRENNNVPTDDYLKNKIRNEIGQYLFSKTGKRPIVLPVVIEV
ncbi:ribonuclease J [Patescibacteria group bacterium]